MHPCYEKLPENKTVDGYPNLKDSNCNYCREMCEKLLVDDKIGFFDGFDIKESLWLVLSIAGFSFLYQLFIHFYRNPKLIKEYR